MGGGCNVSSLSFLLDSALLCAVNHGLLNCMLNKESLSSTSKY